MHCSVEMSLASLALISLLLPTALAFPQAAADGSSLQCRAVAVTTTTTLCSTISRTVIPVTPTTAITSPATCVPPSFPPIRCKRGVVISGSSADALVSAFSNSPKICWTENWYSAPFKNLPSSIQFVPQNYGKKSNLDGTWTKNAEKAIQNGATHFLGFGEPHTDGSLHMEPQEAVDLWMKELQPYTCKVIIGAPSIVQNGRAWLEKFIGLCEVARCRIGFLTCHWYWRADQFEDFKTNVLKCIALANGRWPVWVANWQASGDAAAQKAFIQKAVPWLESQPQVQRYGYVPMENANGFLASSGQGLSDLGQTYANM